MTPARHLLARALCATLLVACTAAVAFDIPPPPPAFYQDLIVPLFPNSTAVPFSGQSGGVGRRSGSSPGATGGTASASTLAGSGGQAATNARQLAQAVPAGQREQMAQVYLKAFDTWHQLERKLGLPANDVAGAVAAFVAGNYMAYRNVEVPDAAYHRLVEQMRDALSTSHAFAQASPGDKRKLYEQMAMVGTFMAVARQSFLQNPNPAAEKNFRDSARANLEAALKVPADQVRIGPNGLSLQ